MGEEEEAAQEILAASSLLLEPTTAATRQPTIAPFDKNNPWGLWLCHAGAGACCLELQCHQAMAGGLLLGTGLCLDFLIANSRAVFQVQVIGAGARDGPLGPGPSLLPCSLAQGDVQMHSCYNLSSECTTSPRQTFILKEGPRRTSPKLLSHRGMLGTVRTEASLGALQTCPWLRQGLTLG